MKQNILETIPADLSSEQRMAFREIIFEVLMEAIPEVIKEITPRIIEEVKVSLRHETKVDNIKAHILRYPTQILDTRAICAIMGWSASTVQRKRDDFYNPLPMYKDGRRYIISKDEFIQYLRL
ncbi:helix-turn-helix domain-containing protein [Halosquirtibacter laminarini]|uniref:Helix-turn-helix domain-containing protein n=1 Tax=Halosquirtibacter laminarini TaxID=3374600 RepID=A0AC61NI41_9BACT|nr:helix-turn-helix domain-containing protein [Prolixibacteraceae bacterium]